MGDDSLRRALDEVECDLRTSEAELARLHQRVAYLRQSAAGLRGLLELGAEKSPDEPGETPEEPSPASNLTVEREPTDRPQSLDAVRMILADRLDEDVHIDDVRAEMKKRDWIDPSWTNPDAAVYAALRRLLKQDDHAQRVSRRVWRLRSTPVPPETSSEPSEDLFADAEDES